ncbi:DUF917 domain-containing protein [Rhodopseudomonas sp. B29]|uniref:DUF917 domain-containing protein n=1 Tax=Rhodopseudomonas sp. B29 TaxID=95607 RepID=UPI0003B602B0|nr:DUF917 domain-containing protein [Rhodopseudomonas sp. B29]
MGRILGMQDVEAAIRGGSVFAAGGGGWADHGRMLGTAAVLAGQPELVSMDEVPDDAFIATAAAIGAPAGTTEWQMLGVDYVKAVDMMQDALGAPIYGLMIGQNGMSSTMNAWLPSAMLGTKVVDAVGDIRAHPTGDMGSIGMAGSPEATIQVAVGGHRNSNSYIELVVRGATAKISPVLRKAADMSGGFIASCRNPVRASYVKKNAALGGISRALELGRAILAAESEGGEAVIKAICSATSGTILGTGKVTRKAVVYTEAAFDIGTITLRCAGRDLALHVMNEYMAVEDGDGKRLATFPDVITTLDRDGKPVSVGHIKEGDELSVFHIAKAHLPLSSSVKDPSVYPVCEAALGIPIASYALG